MTDWILAFLGRAKGQQICWKAQRDDEAGLCSRNRETTDCTFKWSNTSCINFWTDRWSLTVVMILCSPELKGTSLLGAVSAYCQTHRSGPWFECEISARGSYTSI